MTTTNAIRESGSIHYLDLSDKVRGGLRQIFEVQAVSVKEAAEHPNDLVIDLENVVERAHALLSMWEAAGRGKITIAAARELVRVVTEERDYHLEEISRLLADRALYVAGDPGYGFERYGKGFEGSLDAYAEEVADHLARANACDAFLRLVADAEEGA